MHASFTALRQAFATARQERKARHRDIASALEKSEAATADQVRILVKKTFASDRRVIVTTQPKK